MQQMSQRKSTEAKQFKAVFILIGLLFNGHWQQSQSNHISNSNKTVNK